MRKLIMLVILVLAAVGTAAVALLILGPNNSILKSLIVGANDQTGIIYWHADPAVPHVALTFDDGPDKNSTARVLDILKRSGIKATFFVVGKNIKNNSDVLKRESAEGHIIGNHTYYHLDGKDVKIERIKNNLVWTDVLIKKITGKRSMYFRPPFGYENWRFLKEAEKLGYKTVVWSVDAGEWNETQSKEAIASRIIANTGNGSIILLHDAGPGAEKVIEALPVIIEKLKGKGYLFVTVPELIGDSTEEIPAAR